MIIEYLSATPPKYSVKIDLSNKNITEWGIFFDKSTPKAIKHLNIAYDDAKNPGCYPVYDEIKNLDDVLSFLNKNFKNKRKDR